MISPLRSTVEGRGRSLALGLLIVLLARPRIPYVLTTVELGSEALAPTVIYYVLISLLAICILVAWLRLYFRTDFIRAYWPPLIILAVAIASVTWSVAPGVSIRYLVQFIALTAVVMVASSQLSLKSLVFAIGGAAVFLVALSLGYVVAFPEWGVIDTYGGQRWRGAFANQNSFGRWASILFILSIGLLLHSGRRALPLAGATVALIAIVQTGSAQALGASLGIGTILGTIEVVRRSRQRESVAGLLVSAAGLLATSFILFVRIDFRSLLEESLSGRDGLWLTLIPAVLERPFLGHGIGAFWGSDLAGEVRRNAGFSAAHAHNTYIDAALQLGIPFAIMVLLGGLALLVASTKAAIRDPSSWPLLAFVSFLAVYSLSASMVFSGSFEWWLLLVALVCHLVTRSRDAPAVGQDRRIPV